MVREIPERQHGIKVPSTGNRYTIDPRTVRAKLADRGSDEGG